jgi:hypothetical protein
MKGFCLIVEIILIFSFALTAKSQQSQACPKIQLLTPLGAYLSKGATYYVTADIGDFHNSEIKYFWTFKPDLPFEMQGNPNVPFVAAEELGEVKVSVKIEGLPSGCANTSDASFRILFNPGSPLIFDEYGKLPLKEELERLNSVAGQLSELKDSNAVFVIGYKITDTKGAVKYRVRRIIRHLTEKRGVSKNRVQFVFWESRQQLTRIYASPKDAIGTPDWNSQIEKLKIPRN